MERVIIPRNITVIGAFFSGFMDGREGTEVGAPTGESAAAPAAESILVGPAAAPSSDKGEGPLFPMEGAEPAKDAVPTSYKDTNGVNWVIFDRGSSVFSFTSRYIAHSYGYVTDKDYSSNFWSVIKDEIDAFAIKNKGNLKEPEFTGPPGGIKLPIPPVAPEPKIADKPADISAPGAIDDPKVAIPMANSVVIAMNPGVKAARRQIIVAIGWLENRFGLSPAWRYTNASGKVVPTYNWGAIGVVPGGAFTEKPDKDKNGKPITRKVAVFANMMDGEVAFVKVWATPAIESFADDGDAYAVAGQMYANGYFAGEGNAEESILRYAKAIEGSADLAAKVLGEPNKVFLTVPGKVPGEIKEAASSNAPFIAAGVGIAALGLFSLLKK